MSDLAKLRNISLDFRRLSSNFLSTKYEDGVIQLRRLYDYINEEPVLQDIISNFISESDYRYEDFMFLDGFNQKQVMIPIKQVDHIKVVYCYLGELATGQDNNLLHIAMDFGFVYKKPDDSIRSFLEKLFKPLIDFVVDSLSKEIMLLDSRQTVPQYNQHIENNYGTANTGSKIISTNTIWQNDLSEITSLISSLELEIKNSTLERTERESVLDDLEIIKEQVSSDVPKRVRLEKAVSGLKAFVSRVASGVTVRAITSTTFLENANVLLERLQNLLSNIR